MDLNQVTISSLNVSNATKFYQTLGLHLIVDALPRYVRFECPNGNSTFSIHKVDELPKKHGTTIYFEDDNLGDLVNQLKQKGIIFTSEPEDKTWLRGEAHLNDLDGNHIILYKAGKNRKNPPWRINL